jgi:transcriptional regulator with XRE-family HTH domain
MIRPIHVRMARAALNWTVRDLEAKSNVGRNTISRYEAGNDILASSVEKLEKALLEQGVIFFEGDAIRGTGVGLKTRNSSKSRKA